MTDKPVRPEHAVVLRSVAARTVRDARAAWREAHATPTDASVRSAFRACVLAARVLRKAAQVTPGESAAMISQAERIEATASALRDELVGIVEAQPVV